MTSRISIYNSSAPSDYYKSHHCIAQIERKSTLPVPISAVYLKPTTSPKLLPLVLYCIRVESEESLIPRQLTIFAHWQFLAFHSLLRKWVLRHLR